ncbi:Aminoacyl-histidine dipeptidase [Aduncisulcus paluster]|uniref:Aminoacyl-histidine dipeptidase n=1 Tax=Aduncisulcus paluster TaxID=2918883 RepID=A0ABQ5K9V1_9EUKA|nr:Aminoacyl-histidine dipeptidase [Aduncisulcus paluster]
MIARPAAPGYEAKKPIIMQAHMDMVLECSEGVEYDDSKDPIKLQFKDINGKQCLMAQGTTLGADNGIGVAMGLSILLDKDLAKNTGRMELLCTVDEETTMSGAEKLEPGLFKATSMINIDSEDIGEITIGSAGGIEVSLKYSPSRCSKAPSNPVHISVKQCTGGHSGVEIQQPRASAIRVVATLLACCDQKAEIITIVGGSKPNAIPRSCECDLCFATVEDKDKYVAAMKAAATDLIAEYGTSDPEMVIEVEEGSSDTDSPLTAESSTQLVSLLLSLPHGVIRMSADVAGLVETSCNLASIKMNEEGEFIIHLHPRSSVNSSLDIVYKKIATIALATGYCTVSEPLDPYCGWKPNPSSDLLAVMKKCYEDKYGKEVSVAAIHAGLECGMFTRSYPTLDAVSVGPTIANPHTPEEYLEVGTVGVVYEAIKATLIKWFE